MWRGRPGIDLIHNLRQRLRTFIPYYHRYCLASEFMRYVAVTELYFAPTPSTTRPRDPCCQLMVAMPSDILRWSECVLRAAFSPPLSRLYHSPSRHLLGVIYTDKIVYLFEIYTQCWVRESRGGECDFALRGLGSLPSYARLADHCRRHTGSTPVSPRMSPHAASLRFNLLEVRVSDQEVGPFSAQDYPACLPPVTQREHAAVRPVLEPLSSVLFRVSTLGPPGVQVRSRLRNRPGHRPTRFRKLPSAQADILPCQPDQRG